MNNAPLFGKQAVLETERLLLRPIVLDDVNEVLAIYSDDEAGKYNCWSSIEGQKAGLLKIMGFIDAFEASSRIRWGLIDKTTNKLIGDCAYVVFDYRCDRAEIGFNLVRSEWNKGYMSEALKAMLTWGFSMNINRIEALVSLENLPCRALLKKLKFTEEAVLRKIGKKNGKYMDMLLISLLKDEFEA